MGDVPTVKHLENSTQRVITFSALTTLGALLLIGLVIALPTFKPICPAETLRSGSGGGGVVALSWMITSAMGAAAVLFALTVPVDLLKSPSAQPVLIGGGLLLLGVGCCLFVGGQFTYYCLTPQYLSSRNGYFSKPRQTSMQDLVEIQLTCERTRRSPYLSYRLIFANGEQVTEPVADWRGFYKDYPKIQLALSQTHARWVSTNASTDASCPNVAGQFGPTAQ